MKIKYAIALVVSLVSSQALSSPFWDAVESKSGLDIYINEVSPGHRSAVSAHNAYEDSRRSEEANYNETIDKVHDAISDGADLIELDIISNRSNQVRVAHDRPSVNNATLLSEVLADSTFSTANQILFLEIKERQNRAFIEDLIAIIDENNYARTGRPVFIRAFWADRNSLELAQDVITQQYPHLEDYVYYSALFHPWQFGRLDARIRESANLGYDMVELDYRISDLARRLDDAKDLGLGTGLWTLPASMSDSDKLYYRRLADQITTDF